MFIVCHGWIAVVRELPSKQAIASYVLQQAIFWFGAAWIDERLAVRGSPGRHGRQRQFVWAALCTFYVALTAFDALLMNMTSLPLREILPMLLASQNIVAGLGEIGLRPTRLLILFALLLAGVLAGGVLRFVLGRATWPRLPASRLLRWTTWLGLIAVFIAEQRSARDEPDYLFRALHMPRYVQLHDTSSRSVVFSLPPPVSHTTRVRWLEHVAPARNPHHILYVLLESFRADAVDPQVCPTIWQLAQRGTRFERALAEATYTPLSWSVLLFDEAAYDNLFGRHGGRAEPLGGWLLAVLGKAGYDVHLSISTNLTYAKTRSRLLGTGPPHVEYFQAAPDTGDDPSDKNRNDRVAVDHAVQYIQHHDWSAGTRPQFLLVQLDSTHYTYPFPESQALFTPYSENLLLPRPIETEREAELLHNRYLNAARFVDAQLARVIQALQATGVYDDMVIVVTADHGEGLRPGMQGHGAVGDATKRVPMIFDLPGHAPTRSDLLVSHRDILPVLTEYLGIDLPEGALRGRVGGPGPRGGVLTLAPSGRIGQLTMDQRVVELSVVFEPESVIVTPITAAGVVPEKDWVPVLRGFFAQPGRDRVD
jgi:arylsulfatase A-like enzyme